MFTARPIQKEIVKKAKPILEKFGVVYIDGEMRVGKTISSLLISEGYKTVLFITTKKAMASVQSDFELVQPSFDFTLINYESVHKLQSKNYDVIIVDEAHRIGSYPKPSKWAQIIRGFSGRFILMSGTPTPETYSQIYHQLWATSKNIFPEKSFYAWARSYVNIKRIDKGFGLVNDYKEADKEKIMQILKPIYIQKTQKEADFNAEVIEKVHYVEMKRTTYDIASVLKKDKVYQGVKDVILADTPTKLQSKLHQIYTGTIILESGTKCVIDHSKAKYIKEKFKDKKIAIFYKYKAEFTMLQEVFKDDLTTDINEFPTKTLALQIVSGREGINLSEADYLVYINIDFSAVSYWQSRMRMASKERLVNEVHFIFAKNGIEDSIYKAVQNKKKYNVKDFQKWLNSKYKNE